VSKRLASQIRQTQEMVSTRAHEPAAFAPGFKVTCVRVNPTDNMRTAVETIFVARASLNRRFHQMFTSHYPWSDPVACTPASVWEKRAQVENQVWLYFIPFFTPRAAVQTRPSTIETLVAVDNCKIAYSKAAPARHPGEQTVWEVLFSKPSRPKLVSHVPRPVEDSEPRCRHRSRRRCLRAGCPTTINLATSVTGSARVGRRPGEFTPYRADFYTFQDIVIPPVRTRIVAECSSVVRSADQHSQRYDSSWHEGDVRGDCIANSVPCAKALASSRGPCASAGDPGGKLL